MTTQPVPSISDDQIAEIEVKCEEANKHDGSLIISAGEVSALVSRLRAAEKDAERYQWLRDGESEKFLTFYACGFPGDQFDEAIDAAMTEAKP